jgi:hypothetical protein
MQRLFDPERHEALTDAQWDAGVAQGAIEAIVVGVLNAARDGLWPTHALEDGGLDEGRTLYMGAAGVIWGLSYLASQEAIAEDDRFVEWALALPDRYLATPDTGSVVPSYFLGEAGVLLLALRAQRRSEWEDRLFAGVKGNIHNPTREPLWGASGTALAAVFAHELTGAERWRVLFLENMEALTHTWQRHQGDDCDLWTQDLYGNKGRMLGAAHGFAGNVFAFLRGFELLPESARTPVLARALDTLRETVSTDRNRANWPPFPESDKSLVQWCHGAPGILTSFGRAPADAGLDELLVQGGELIWQAGPLRKGSSLCHGTAGNGAALLTLFSRTGDSEWLDRARLFAMHSIRQVAAARATYGQGRYSLWTGDVGVAMYLWQCLRATSGMVSLDF